MSCEGVASEFAVDRMITPQAVRQTGRAEVAHRPEAAAARRPPREVALRT